MATTKQLVTADELLNMPDDGMRYELVRGELRKMPPAGHPHSRMGVRIATRLDMFTTDRGLGYVYGADGGFILESDPDHVRAPDVSFVRQARVDEASDSVGFFPGPPDLAIEVISPNDRYTEVEEKVADYLAAGTLAVVVVDPRRRVVKVHRPHGETVGLGEGDTLEIDDVVPGWRILVGEMFE